MVNADYRARITINAFARRPAVLLTHPATLSCRTSRLRTTVPMTYAVGLYKLSIAGRHDEGLMSLASYDVSQKLTAADKTTEATARVSAV